MLPFIEQGNVWKAATPVTGGFAGSGVLPEWSTPGQGTQYLRQTRIPVYICPSDATVATNLATDWTPGEASYAPNFQVFGSSNYNPSAAINFADWDGNTRFASITDGQSNTIFMAEKLSYCPGVTTAAVAAPNALNGNNSAGGSWWMRGIYNSGTITGTSPPSATDSYPGDRVSAVFGGGKSGDGTQWYIGPSSKPNIFGIPPNNTTSGICDRGLASSPHVGIIVVGMGDGSVRTVSSSVDANTWWAACTRTGGEVLGPNW
jgi:hypothetical protein